MQDQSRRFFEQAIETPSPSGYEERIQAVIKQYIEPHADKTRIDIHGWANRDR